MAKMNTRQKELLEAKRRLDREKASGKAPVVKTVLNNNQATVESYIEDRPKRLEAKIGSPRLDDAQITYNNKKFNKRKKTKDGGNFEWDGKMLKGLSNKKYGKSYAAKFNSLANEAGIPHNERGAFKDFLDAKEYKANPNDNSDKATFENDRRVDRLMKQNEYEKTLKKEEVKKTESKDTARDKVKGSSSKDIRGDWKDDLMTRLASLTAFDDVGYKREQDKKEEEGFEMSGLERGATRFANKANLGIPEQLEKRATGETPDYATSRKFGEGGGTDLVSDLLGYIAPGVGATAGLRALGKGADLSTKALSKAGALTRAKEGAAVGGIMSGAEVGAREGLNPDDYNWKQNLGQIALETGAGAVLDPLVSMLGAGIKTGADRSIGRAVQSSNEDLVSRMMQDVGNVPTMPSPLDDMTPQDPLARLLGQAQSKSLQFPRLDIPDTKAQGDQALADYTRQFEQAQNLATQSREARTNPLGLTDYEPNFTMRDSNQLRLNAPNEANIPRVPRPDAPLEEKIAYWKDPEMARTETDVRQVVQEMERIESDISQFNENLPQLRAAEISKDPTIASIHARSKELLEESAQAEASWSTIKQVQDQFKDPAKRPEWAYFSLDSQMRNSEESGLIPTRFIAKGQDKDYGIDFAKAMDLAGFDNEVDFIQHLQFINDQLNTTRKSLSTLGIKDSKDAAKQLESFENQFDNDIREQFGISELESQLDELSSLATPYEPPVNPVQDLMFKTTQRNEVPRDPITEILYPNAQYGVDRGTLNSPRGEVAVTTSEAPTGPESIGIEQAPNVAQVEPRMVRVKQQENLQAQALDVVIEQPDTLKTIISKGTKDSEKYAKRIIDTATKNPVLKVARKFRQSMVASMNSATYAERDLLKKSIPDVEARLMDAQTDAEKISLEYELDELNRRLKASKDTSYTQMALENETGADIKASIQANDFVKKLSSIEGATLPEMANWQLAKRIKWLESSENTNKALPDSWIRFANQTLEDGQGNTAYEQSEAIFRELQETRLNNIRQQKSEAEIEALLKEPYYIPLYLDKSYKVAKGSNSGKLLKGMKAQPRANSSEVDTIKAFAHEESAGSSYEFIQNPIESIIDDLFREQRSIARNDTAQQFRRLGQMDDLGTYVKEVDEKKFNMEKGETNPTFLKGYENGEPFYLEIHPEFREMLQSIDSIEGVDPVQIATSIMSRLKTTSPEYLATAIPRDLMTSFLNTESASQYATGLWKSLTDQAYRQTGIDAGVQFRNAYDPQSAAQQGTEQLQKQIKEMAGFTDVDATNLEKASGTISKAWDKLTTPVRKIGQISDDIPRIIEANIVKKRWEENVLSRTREAITKVETELQNAPQGDFEAGPQLQAQLEQLQKRLDMETRGMEREMTHRGRDVMPYQRSGSSFAAKGFKKYVNFANTTTQSKDKLARSFTSRPVSTSIKGIALASPMYLIVNQMYDGLSSEEQQMYDAIPDYVKQQRYVVPIGNGEYYTVPKVQELAILSNMVDAEAGIMSYESALEYAGKELTPFQAGGLTQGLIGASFVEGDDKQPGGRTLANVRENATIPGTVVSPLLDTFANTKTSFNGKPVSYSRDGMSGDYTMDIFDSLAGGSDWADAMQYGATQYGGDWGKYGLGMIDSMIGPSEEDSHTSRQSLNPLQDYFYTPNQDPRLMQFKKMFYDKDKLPK